MAGERELTILMKARDEASTVIGKVGKNVQAQQKHFKAAGLAVAGLGVGLEALAKKQQPLTESTRKLAVQTGFSEEAIRNMATELSNATFPLDSVLALMELGSQRGLESADALQEYATFWDTVGDATGLSAEKLAEAATGMQALGISAGDESELLEAFGLVMSTGAGDVAEFTKMVGKLAPEMTDMGLTVDEAAVFFAAMQEELGLTSRVAQTEFKEAMEQSTTGIEGVKAMLGLTDDQLSKYRDQLALSGDTVQEFADVHASTKTVTDRLKSSISDLIFENGALIEKASMLAPIFMVAGPVIAAFGPITTASMTIAGAAVKGFSIAVKLAMGPAGLALLAIAAMIAIGVLLYKNWDTIKAVATRVFNWIRNLIVNVFTKITDIYNSKLGWLLPAGPLIKAILFLRDNWNTIWNGIKDTFKTITDTMLGIWNGLVGGIKGAINTIIGAINGFIRGINAIEINFPGVSLPFGRSIGAFTIGLPDIPELPTLARGGEIMRAGLAVVGERGRELVSLPRGAEVSPLSRRSERGGIASINVTVNVQGSVLGAELSDIVAEGVEEAQRRGTLAVASAV